MPSSCIFTKRLPKVGENAFASLDEENEDTFYAVTITYEDEEKESEMNFESHCVYESNSESLECNVAYNLKNELLSG